MKNKKTNIFIVLGLLLISAALILTTYNIVDSVRAERAAQQAADRLLQELESAAVNGNGDDLPDYLLNPKMKMPVREIDGQEYIGVLRVPALSLKLPVLSDWDYDKLKIAPCRYVGSVYMNNMIIAAHNYWSHFGALRSLQPGDRVTFTDMNGNRFNYEVAQTQTLLPDDVREMKSGDWDLTLFTCTFGGGYRITVRCNLLSSKSNPKAN